MTQLTGTAQPPATGTPLLEARALTKHFPVHGAGHGAAGTGRRGLRGARRRLSRGGPDRAAVVHAVESVSLTLAEAQITAVVGESGSGKSTLARLLARLIRPTSGELLVNGSPVRATRRGGQSYARLVQLVLQDPFSSLNPVHDVRYHLARPLQVHGLREAGTSMDDAINALLERVALTPASQFLHKYPHELSGGQRQRVAIARALAVQPRVLLADEPVSMLDTSIRIGLLNLMAQLRDSEGVSILYITHDIASARYVADKLIVMYAGQIAETGPIEDVLARPRHPYTQLLLSAVPDPRAPLSVEADTDRGEPPKVIDPVPGCRFRWRCPLAIDTCERVTPVLAELLPGHDVACHVAQSGAEVKAFS